MRGSNSDALGSLLDDLGGMEANAFSRPKTLVDMRDSEKSTKSTGTQEGSLKARESMTGPTAPSWGSPKQSTHTSVDQYSGYHETAHSLDQLENMLSNARFSVEETRTLNNYQFFAVSSSLYPCIINVFFCVSFICS